MHFRAMLELHGRTATGLVVPPEVVDALGGGKRPPVRVTINGFTYRSTIAFMGGRFMLGVSAENREGAGVGAGDEVDVEVTLDEAPRIVLLPDDLAAAFAAAPGAQAAFDALAASHRKEWVRWVEDAKKPETRAVRVTKTVEGLLAGKKTH
jgi:hypothetical protein